VQWCTKVLTQWPYFLCFSKLLINMWCTDPPECNPDLYSSSLCVAVSLLNLFGL
jgi:hypothetical protein